MRLARASLVALLLACSFAFSQQEPVTFPIGPGVSYMSERREAGPWEVRCVRIDRNAPFLRLDTALGMGKLRGVETMSGIIKRETSDTDRVISGFNADFFIMAGDPWAGLVCGLTVRRGELVMTARDRPAFLVMADGTLRIGTFNTTGEIAASSGSIPITGINETDPVGGVALYTHLHGWPQTAGCVVVRSNGLALRPNGVWRAKVAEIVPPGKSREAAQNEVLIRADGAGAAALGKLAVGDEITISLKTPGLEGPVEMAVGGSAELVKNGRIVAEDKPGDPRHPRTTVGFSGKQIVFATVDGRQAGWSVGMTLGELAHLMQDLGCENAINLDGGGSTTAWIRGKVTNRPSDGGERRIADAVLVRSTAPRGPLTQLIVRPQAITALSGANVPLDLRPVDRWFNPVPVGDRQIQARALPSPSGVPVSAHYVRGVLHLHGSPGLATVRLSCAGVDTFVDIPVRLVDRCEAITVSPPTAAICAGEAPRFEAQGRTGDGKPVWAPSSAVQWSAEGEGILALPGGKVLAMTPGTRAHLKAKIGAVEGAAEIVVAGRFPLEGFETGSAPAFTAFPEAGKVSGRIDLQAGDAGEGRRFCRLTYDLGAPKATRAAYIHLDRPLGKPLRLSLLARGTGSPAYLRVAVIDGNGTRQTYTLCEAVNWSGEWRRVSARLPEGIKSPVRWETVYVVATDGKTGKGSVDIADLQVERVE